MFVFTLEKQFLRWLDYPQVKLFGGYHRHHPLPLSGVFEHEPIGFCALPVDNGANMLSPAGAFSIGHAIEPRSIPSCYFHSNHRPHPSLVFVS
jgi:hypothetical protein